MEAILKIVRFYLLSIDAVIRLIGTYLITGLLFAALGLLLNSLNWLLFGTFSTGPLHLWIGLILAPPILRIGVLAGGFSIPPLLNRPQKSDATKDKANKTLHSSAGNAPV
jgi:hypothetical protein